MASTNSIQPKPSGRRTHTSAECIPLAEAIKHLFPDRNMTYEQLRDRLNKIPDGKED